MAPFSHAKGEKCSGMDQHISNNVWAMWLMRWIAPRSRRLTNGRLSMLRNVFLAAAATVILAGATMTAPVSVQAGHSDCHKMAKAKYPADRKARHAYKKACKAHYKAGKTGLLKGGLFKKN